MRLKSDYLVYDASTEERIAVATGDEAKNFNGLLRANETAGAILDYLKNETTEDEIVARILEDYDTTEENARKGLAAVLSTLRSVGAIEE